MRIRGVVVVPPHDRPQAVQAHAREMQNALNGSKDQIYRSDVYGFELSFSIGCQTREIPA